MYWCDLQETPQSHLSAEFHCCTLSLSLQASEQRKKVQWAVAEVKQQNKPQIKHTMSTQVMAKYGRKEVHVYRSSQSVWREIIQSKKKDNLMKPTDYI